MTRNGVPRLTLVSGDPNPFISTGKLQDQCADQKTTFFGEFTIYPQVIGGPTDPRDIECGLDYQTKPASSGNYSFRLVFRPDWVTVGYD